MLVISSVSKVILYISRSYVGSAHDFGILKEEFPPQKAWFARFNVRLDLGFLGFSDLYPCCQLYIPFKKPRKNDLPQEAKADNKVQASQRVKVEHSIGGLKRYRILSDKLRVRDPKLYDSIVGICAGLWNLNFTTH